MCAARQLPAQRVGVVDSGLGPDAGYPVGTQVLQFNDWFTLTLDELRDAHTKTLPGLFA
jgi:hypothetical protein